MSAPRLQLSPFRVLSLAVVFLALLFLAVSCGGSKANVRKDETNNSGQPAAVEVTTAPAIVRELPRFFEATGSLTGDEQTDVSPEIAGKVVAVGWKWAATLSAGR